MTSRQAECLCARHQDDKKTLLEAFHCLGALLFLIGPTRGTSVVTSVYNEIHEGVYDGLLIDFLFVFGFGICLDQCSMPNNLTFSLKVLHYWFELLREMHFSKSSYLEASLEGKAYENTEIQLVKGPITLSTEF